MAKPRVPPPLLALAAAAAMWGLDRIAPVAALLPRPGNRVGIAVAIAGVTIVVLSMNRFRRQRTTINPLRPETATVLVTAGLYRYSRNPMYLGLAVLLTGWALWLGTLSPWLLLPVFVALITRLQIAPEERALRERFGSEYQVYCQRVPRWLGRPRST